jgi:hypothetical protein
MYRITQRILHYTNKYFCFIRSFFLRKFQNIFQYFWFWRKPTPPPIKDATTEYMEKHKTKFMESFSKDLFINWSSNINNVFDNRTELKNLLQEPKNWLEKEWQTRLLYENSPRGNIIMYYDVYKEGFAYYSDTSCIPYPILNAVAMKYTLLYRCRDFFVDQNILGEHQTPFIKYKQLEEAEEAKKKKKTAEAITLDDEIFVKRAPIQPVETKPKTKEVELMTNKFLYMGKLGNFSMLQKPPKKRVLPAYFLSTHEELFADNETNKGVSYKKFKLLMESNKEQRKE